jgi:hypothetical protein
MVYQKECRNLTAKCTKKYAKYGKVEYLKMTHFLFVLRADRFASFA